MIELNKDGREAVMRVVTKLDVDKAVMFCNEFGIKHRINGPTRDRDTERLSIVTEQDISTIKTCYWG